MYYDYVWYFLKSITDYYDFILEVLKPITAFYALWPYLVFFRSNHSFESSLHQNKTLRYFRSTPSAKRKEKVKQKEKKK